MTEMNRDKEVIIKVDNLKKNFGSLEVLKGISTEIYKGEVLVVIGPSGSGKSTFLRCLNLLEEPTSGHIYFKGEEVTAHHKGIDKFRQHIGMVFQLFNLFENKSVLENVTLGPIKVLHMDENAAKASMFIRINRSKKQNFHDVFPRSQDLLLSLASIARVISFMYF